MHCPPRRTYPTYCRGASAFLFDPYSIPMAVSLIRIIKRITRDNAIDWTVTALKTLSDVSPVPPLTVATNVVLSILQLVSDIKTNQQGCLSLAQRATELLMFLQKRMEGKGDAPQSLLDDIREFEETLRSIHKFMCQLSQMSLIRRGFEKSSIQEQLVQHEQKLEGARWRFQLSLSIETRYALSAFSGAPSNNTPRIAYQGIIANPMGSLEAPSSLAGYPSKCPVSSFEVVDQFHGHGKSPSPAHPIPTEEEEFLADMIGDTDEFGFHRYHQSDVIIRKSNRKTIGWFQGSSDADVCGRKMTIKRYDEEKDLALKQWVRDIKALRHLQFVTVRCLVASVAKSLHVSHENLPQMLGYSNGKTPIPFILLAGVQNRALDEVMRSVLTTRGLADCASLILRTSAIAHAQRQLSLSEIDAQCFIEHATYSIDSDNAVIVGLPPSCVVWNRLSYGGLKSSVEAYVIQILREFVVAESSVLQVRPHKAMTFNRYERLLDLLYFLFPGRGERLALSSELEDLLDGVDEDNPLTLSALRAVSKHQSQSVRLLRGRYLVRSLKPGDYGYITGHSMDFSNFVVLGNVQDGECVDEMKHVVGEADCTMFMCRHDPVTCHRSDLPAGASSVADERECWEVPLLEEDAGVRVCHKTGLASAKSAWEFLVTHGASLASRHGIEPQALVLVTRYGHWDYYHTTGWSSSLRNCPSIESGSTTSDCPAFPVPEFRAEAPSDMSMLYFITSSRHNFEAYVTDEPLTALPHHYCHPFSHAELVDYIQLDAEDMVS
ncbi:hypothetical protein BC826DRAFT_636418 [Russula brevipes]|nr:hypothetical protein BC826DRAFT_636418 [Russula brevipes]